jgi:hypothetical protein
MEYGEKTGKVNGTENCIIMMRFPAEFSVNVALPLTQVNYSSMEK